MWSAGYAPVGLLLVGALTLQVPTERRELSYDSFMARPPAQRAELFVNADPETKALLVKAHAQRWLDKNIDLLNARQVQLVKESIALISPELYRQPHQTDPSTELARRSRELGEQLQCRFGRADLIAAFKPEVEPPPPSWFDDLWHWFSACLLK
jgi:hypothetical protein